MSYLKINGSQFEISVWAFQPTTKLFPSEKENSSNRIKEVFQIPVLMTESHYRALKHGTGGSKL